MMTSLQHGSIGIGLSCCKFHSNNLTYIVKFSCLTNEMSKRMFIVMMKACRCQMLIIVLLSNVYYFSVLAWLTRLYILKNLLWLTKKNTKYKINLLKANDKQSCTYNTQLMHTVKIDLLI